MGLWDSSDWTPTGISLQTEPKAARRGRILLHNPLISWEIICCCPGRLVKPGVEGQGVPQIQIQSSHISVVAERGCSHATSCIDCVLKPCKMFVYRHLSLLRIWPQKPLQLLDKNQLASVQWPALAETLQNSILLSYMQTHLQGPMLETKR